MLDARRPLRIWVIARVPLFFAALWLFANDTFVWIATDASVHLLGSLPERLVAFALMAAVVGASLAAASRVPSAGLRFAIPLVACFATLLWLSRWAPGRSALLFAAVPTVALAANTIPDRVLAAFLSAASTRRIADACFAVAAGVSELLLVKPLLSWLTAGARGPVMIPKWARGGWIALLVTPALAAGLLDPYALCDQRHALAPDPAVRRVARGNFNWTAIDLDRRRLYACGHGTDRVHAFSIDSLDAAPRVSPVSQGYAQGFALDAAERRIYVYNAFTTTLLTLDAGTLDLVRSTPTIELSLGDIWVAWDSISRSIVIASEADELEGTPTIVVRPPDDRLVDRLDFAPNNVAIHPERPWLYLSFLRRVKEVIVWDLERRRVVMRAPAPRPLDRLIFVRDADGWEMLATSPLESRVLRFDAETLEPRGAFRVGFGDRAIAVDTTRGLLLTGSLVTHRLQVFDWASGQRVGVHHVGPWLRTIELDPAAGVAFVSSHGGIHAVRYAEPRSPQK